MCGEKGKEWCMTDTGVGSPPRVRGKGTLLFSIRPLVGITPACAGKRMAALTTCGMGWDHPRVCGEKHFGQGPGLELVGSPPRVRGKGCILAGGVGAQGITPACAGKSPCRKSAKPAGGDHPRVCGEKSPVYRSSAISLGSPPRVRGKAKELPPRQCYLGITPACAGKSP